MAGFSKVMLMGNLTRDPELRVTPGGISICKFSLAISRKFKGQDGSNKEDVLFIDVDAFGKQGDVVAKYFTKGKPIFVEGRLKLDQWEANGEKKSKIGVVLESFQFVGGGSKDGSDDSSSSSLASSPASKGGYGNSDVNMDIDDDVPF